VIVGVAGVTAIDSSVGGGEDEEPDEPPQPVSRKPSEKKISILMALAFWQISPFVHYTIRA
jgi:hypothetical protein